MSLKSEIYEQPAIIRELINNQIKTAKDIALQLKKTEFDYIFIAARGTSDNAARYAKYLMGRYNQIPIGLAAPSLFSIYKQPPVLKGALVMGISQSGQSPDIVEVLAEGRRQGRPTLAVTNNPESPLAKNADWVIDIQAGEEKAVAATKTFTAELVAIALLSIALKEDYERLAFLELVPSWMEKVLQKDDAIAKIAQRYLYMDQCVVLGRSYNYAAAYEWSLKLKELTYVVADPYSSADFMHGPIALVERGFPVMAFAPSGEVYSDILELIRKLREINKAELLVISDRKEALDLAQSPIDLPEGIPEWVSPIIGILAAQLFAYHLTQVKGFDAEKPRGLHKVTETH